MNNNNQQWKLMEKALSGGEPPSHNTGSLLRKSSSMKEIIQIDTDKIKLTEDQHSPLEGRMAAATHHPKSLGGGASFEEEIQKAQSDKVNLKASQFAKIHESSLQVHHNQLNEFGESTDPLSQVDSTSLQKRKIRLGICCMEKKMLARPMREILKHVTMQDPNIEILRFGDDMIQNRPIHEWHRVDILIGFYSFGFPLEKAIEYVKAYKPQMINDLTVQQELWDRTLVLDKLRRAGVPVANSYAVYRGTDKQDMQNQNQIEHQSAATKDRGEFYIDKAKKRQAKMHAEVNQMAQSVKFQRKQSHRSLMSNESPPEEATTQNTNQLQHLNNTNLGGGSPNVIKEQPAVVTLLSQKVSSIKQAQSDPTTPTSMKAVLNRDSISSKTTTTPSVFRDPNIEESKTRERNQSAGLKKDKEQKDEENDILYEDKEVDLQEYDDYIIVRGNKLKKPFIEKPINAENHEIMIHYSNNSPCGSGYSVLFRKTQSVCSQFIPTKHESTIRRTGSYIYEEFLPTDGFDIKVYTVGEDYAHAEARKCPSIDGVVQRDPHSGKEVRYPVNLMPQEKEMARRICTEFKQEICGFDMLRSGGNTYVCDVNGFSFVKTSDKYYEDCAIQVRKIIYRKLRLEPAPERIIPETLSQQSSNQDRTFRPKQVNTKKKRWELRSVVAIFRHGDRTPKQKMKMKTNDPGFLQFFDKSCKEVKIKKPKEMQKVLKIAQENIKKILTSTDPRNIEKEKNELEKLVQLKYILEKDILEGLSRKIQLRALQCTNTENVNADETLADPYQIKKVLEALLVLKFGGELTHSGVNQAETFGSLFRQNMYVEEKDNRTGGLLRLHSTYRHDLKVYTSDEGRCQKTAAAFLKGLLQIEGALAPILAIMITKDKQAKKMVDDSSAAQEILGEIKEKLTDFMHYNGEDANEEFYRRFQERPPQIIVDILSKIKCPYTILKQISGLVDVIISQIEELLIAEGTLPEQIESYRQTPLQFDKIFHATSQHAQPRRGMSLNQSISPLLTSSQKVGGENDEDNKVSGSRLKQYRSFSIEKGSQQSLLDLESSVSVEQDQDSNEKKDQYLKLKENCLEPIIEKGSVDYQSSCSMEESKILSEEELDLESYQKMKMDYLERLEMATQQSTTSSTPTQQQQQVVNSTNQQSSQIPNNNNSAQATGGGASEPQMGQTTKIYEQMIKEEQIEEDGDVKNLQRGTKSVGVSVNYNMTQENQCEGQPYLIMLKRWKKIQADFKLKAGKFDISKVPEICDNIKFDNLHNPELMDPNRLDLMDLSQLVARLLVPMEYGITTEEKLQVGSKITAPLLRKIYHDLLWWKTSNDGSKTEIHSRAQQEFGEDKQFRNGGLDEGGVGSRVKSSWRHIRTRLYFTSASHMYTLLNMLKLGVNSFLLDENDKALRKKLDDILRLDFMSGFVFRLFEDLSGKEGDLSRFKLEIMVNRGAVVNRQVIQTVEKHTLPIKHENFIDINKKLTLDQLDHFFQELLKFEDPNQTSDSQKKKEKKKDKKEKKEKKEGKVECVQCD